MCIIRLLAGAALNVILLLMIPSLAKWSSLERECWTALKVSSIGAVAIVFLVPLLWRAKDPLRVFALMLLVLPCLSFWPALDFILTNR